MKAKKIQWVAKEYCPENQLSHNGHKYDAGYDLRFAEDCLIKPYKHIPVELEQVCKVSEWKGENVPYYENVGTIFNQGNPEEWIIRRKYQIQTIKTGVVLVQPDDVKYLSWSLVVPRSSTSKYGVALANTVGVIDVGYTGEIGIRAYSLDSFQPFRAGEALFQVIAIPQFGEIEFELVDVDPRTETRDGWGSTGA